MEKDNQRKILKHIRNNILKSDRDFKSSKIAKLVFESSDFKKSKTIMIYMSFGSEVDTKKIFDRILSEKKVLAVPVCDVDTCMMRVFIINSYKQLSEGSYGILEPSTHLIENGDIRQIQKNEVDLVIVPGLGFDKNGYRIGYGKGYYDRFLRDFCGKTIGLCFKECFCDTIYHDEFDIYVDKVFVDSTD